MGKEYIPKNSMRRLIFMSGGLGKNFKVSKLVYLTSESIVKPLLLQLVKNTYTITEYFKRTTIKLIDVEEAIKTITGRTFSSHKGEFVVNKFEVNKKKKVLKKEGMDKATLYIPKASFRRLVKQCTEELGIEVGISAIALYNMQSFIEMNIRKTIEAGILCMLNAKRRTLYPRDIQCANGILKIFGHNLTI